MGRHPQRCDRDRHRPALGSAGLQGAVLRRFLPPSVSAAVDAGRDHFAAVTAGRRCAGFDYPAMVDGGQDFVLSWRTLPWDHAPGVLLLQEARGLARRPALTDRPTPPRASSPAPTLQPGTPCTPVSSQGATEPGAPSERHSPQNRPRTGPVPDIVSSRSTPAAPGCAVRLGRLRRAVVLANCSALGSWGP